MIEPDNFPGNIGQIKNFLRVLPEIHDANEISKAQDEVSRFQSVILSSILYGLGTLIPNEIRASGILTDPNRRKMVRDLLALQVRLNDRVDFSNAHRLEIDELTENAITKEVDAKATLNSSLKKLNIPQLEMTINNSLKEVETVEAFIALRKGGSFHDIEMYRNIVNAISNCAVTQAILGPSFLSDRLQPLAPDKMDWQAICEKYMWVLSAEPQNHVERAVQIMHNLGMAAQIDDDWMGRKIDRALGIESFASAAMEEKDQNPEQAKEFLDEIKSAYLTRATKLGLNPTGKWIIDGTQHKMQKFIRWATRNARFSNNPLVRSFLEKKVVPHLGPREIAYVDGKIG